MSSKQWVVGYFNGENKYSVIPNNWLIQCGTLWISKWPKSGNIATMIAEYADTSSDWPTYPVKIVSQFYNTYDDAVVKEKEIFISASASESESFYSDTRARLPKKQKLNQNKYKQEESDTSCSSSTLLSPIHIKIPTNKNQNIDSSSNINLETTEVTTDTFYQTISNVLNSGYELQEEPFHELLPPQEKINNVSSIDQIINNQSNETVTMIQNDKIEMMSQQISTILAYIKRLDEKLDKIVNNYNAASIDVYGGIEDDFLSLFPMKSVEALNAIESKLVSDKAFEDKLINCVNVIGGTNIHNFVQRVYRRLYTNELATQYSWTGFRHNNQLQNLKITKIIKDVCMRTFKGTEIEFESNLKNWFKNGSQRLSREKK